MSQTTSATTGRRYGLERVCRTWERSRSAFYARGGLACSVQRRLTVRAAAGRRPRCRMRSCWRPFTATWPALRSRARAIARSTRVAQGLGRRCGSVEADVARGLALRMDHGSQYLSDHFLNQVRYWGIRPSFGFVEEPETNGVVERWNRTLKEQAVYGRVFRNLADVHAAVAEFVERYNRCWRLEKLAYRTPPPRGTRGVRATPSRVAQTCVQETECGTPLLRGTHNWEPVKRHGLQKCAVTSG